MSKRARNALIGAGGVIALTMTVLIQPWEGRSLTAYRDMVNVWTICDGNTKGVRPGMVKTDAECDEQTLRRLEHDYYKPLTRCISGYTDLPISLQASLLSAAWNVGVGAICRSTAASRAMAGDHRGACDAVTWFNRAGGRVVRGLKLRREYGDANRIGELELCLEGLQ